MIYDIVKKQRQKNHHDMCVVLTLFQCAPPNIDSSDKTVSMQNRNARHRMQLSQSFYLMPINYIKILQPRRVDFHNGLIGMILNLSRLIIKIRR